MEARYVVDEGGERIAVLLGIEEYGRLVAQRHAPTVDAPVHEKQRDAVTSDEPPDGDEEFGPEEAERRITEFITSADELPGPSVANLAEHAAELMRATWSDMEEIIGGKPHNKALAAQLLLSQQARGLQANDPEQWRLFAATTLLSGMVSAPDGGGG